MEAGETIEYHGWNLRVRVPNGDGPLRVLFLIHGLLGDENVMWIFLPRLPKDALIIAPRGLYPVGDGGYTWQASERTGLPTMTDLQPAVTALQGLMDDLAVDPPGLWAPGRADFSQVDLLGFSQGGAVSSLFALMYPQRVRKLGSLASFMPAGVDAFLHREPLAGKKVFVAHGAQDETVPISKAERAVDALEQAGAEVIFCVDDVGHKLSLDCFKGLGVYFSTE